MSYCVNCGVELASSEKKCPLCDTIVINPQNPQTDTYDRPYPRYVEKIIDRIDHRYGAALISVLLPFPALICLILDIGDGDGISWSIYVIGALIVLFTCILLPSFFKKHHTVLYAMLDTIVVLLYLWVINYGASSGGWFMPLAMPITLCTSALMAITFFSIRSKKIRGLYNVSAVLFFAGILTVCINMIINAYIGLQIIPTWSLFALVPCVIMSILFMLLEKRNKLKEEIKRRLFL